MVVSALAVAGSAPLLAQDPTRASILARARVLAPVPAPAVRVLRFRRLPVPVATRRLEPASASRVRTSPSRPRLVIELSYPDT